MTVVTIKVLRALRDRLHRLVAADRLTVAQEMDRLIDQRAPGPKPTIGGFRSSRPLTAEEIDSELAIGFRQ